MLDNKTIIELAQQRLDMIVRMSNYWSVACPEQYYAFLERYRNKHYPAKEKKHG